MARTNRVRDLAREADTDLDVALVSLWDAGLHSYDGPDDLISRRDMPAAMRALGLGDAKAQMNVEYWTSLLGLTRDDLTARLAEIGVVLPPTVRRLPKGALRRVRKHFASAVEVIEPPSIEVVEDPPPFEWTEIGQRREIRYLSEQEIEAIHGHLTEEFALSGDPILPPGVKDQGLLSSAASRPRTALGDVLKYPTVEMAAAALFHSVALNHCFFNGNKRTALVSMLAMLDENGLVVTCDQDQLFRFTLTATQRRLVKRGLPSLADREVLEIARWISRNSRRVEQGERPLKWIRFKRILRGFGCEMAPANGVGNRLDIWREVPQTGVRKLRSKTRRLSVQVAWGGDGAEAERDCVHLVRARLELDDQHNIDSATFYRGAEIDAFIIDHRRVLRRLAKL